jgi:hypothetical protein
MCTAQQPLITNGLVGYWSLDGNALDKSDNNNNGTLYGAISANDKCNNINSALEFDGIDDYIQVDGNLGLGIEQFSGFAWINLSAYTDDELSYEQKIFGESMASWEFEIENTDELGFKFDASYSCYVSTSNFNIPLNQWVFVGFVFNSGYITFYYNGYSESFDRTICGTPNSNLTNFYIGKRPGFNGLFNGMIDEVMVYNRALTSSEVTYIFENSSCNIWKKSEQGLFYENGNIGIGTSKTIFTDGSYRLAVDGKIRSKEVKVTLDDWSDFVFKPEYKLMPINELEIFINNNSHLPAIPSEEEVQKSGVSLGEMNAKLLQKIEELTLYTIEQQKEIEKLKERLDKVENE